MLQGLYHVISRLTVVYTRIVQPVTSTASEGLYGRFMRDQERDRAAALVEGYEATSVTK